MKSYFSQTGVRFYKLVDAPNEADMVKLGFRSYHEARKKGYEVVSVATASKRAPKKGEWFLSGAIPEGYKARNDMSGTQQILRLTLLREQTVFHLVLRKGKYENPERCPQGSRSTPEENAQPARLDSESLEQ